MYSISTVATPGKTRAVPAGKVFTRGLPRSVAGTVFALVLAGSVVLPRAVTFACSTPVYQYAMYNWPPAPYYVFFFHEGPISEQDKQLHQLAEKLATEGRAVANLSLYPVDLAKSEEYERLPESVRKSWEKYRAEQEQKQQPVTSGYAVYTAWGAELLVGQLDQPTLKAMVDSPARVRLGQLFHEGSAVVVLFMPGADKEENQRVEKLVQSLIDEVATGKLMGMPIYTPLEAYGPIEPVDEQDEASEDGDQPAEPAQPKGAGLKIGMLSIARDDPKETWLLRSLMAIDPELDQLRDKPMLFFCYGRGRAMPPYVGEGITMENLAGEVQFLSGACSCMVKDANPGVDLLMKWDWDATAEAMALAYDPQFQAMSDYGYQEVEVGGSETPSQIDTQVASTDSMADQVVAGVVGQADREPASASSEAAADDPEVPASDEPSAEAAAAATELPPTTEVAFAPTPGSAPPEAVAPADSVEMESPGAPTPVAAAADPEAQAGSFITRQVWILAGVLVTVLLAMLFIGRFAIGR